MVPAPRGAGIVAARVPKKVLQFAGIDDVFTSSRGSTKTLGNFVKVMGGEEAKDPLKGVDWKSIGSELQKDPSAGTKAVVKKRLPKKIRQIPEFYFLPLRSLPSAIAFYGACIAGGVGAGMLLEVWINKKVREDGGVIWEFDK